jgi:hypothetical protein
MVANALGTLNYGDIGAQQLSRRFGGTFATRAALKGLSAKFRCDGMIAMVATDGSLWRFGCSSVLTTDVAEALLLIPTVGTGVWFRVDKTFVARLAIGFGTLDAASLLTVPEGFVLRPAGFPYWEVNTAFSGGASSAIGVSTNKASYNTKGDLLGGAAGDVAASLTAGIKLGTIGPKFDTLAEWQALLLVEGDQVRFDRITSAYTAGSGNVMLPLFVDCAGPATP